MYSFMLPQVAWSKFGVSCCDPALPALTDIELCSAHRVAVPLEKRIPPA